jgi:putative endonuclease
MTYWVYILASRKNGTLYIGVTSNLARRIFEHRQGRGSGFVQKYRVSGLFTLNHMKMLSVPSNVKRR